MIHSLGFSSFGRCWFDAKIYTVSFEPGLSLPGMTGIKFQKKMDNSKIENLNTYT